MKKLILLLLCTATLGLVSCKKTVVAPQAMNKTVVFDISPNQWIPSSDGLTYSYEFNDLPEIDDYGYKYDGTLVYLSYPNYGSYQQIPHTFNVDAISYSSYVGGIAIDIQSSDFQEPTPNRPTQIIRVKVILVASENVS